MFEDQVVRRHWRDPEWSHEKMACDIIGHLKDKDEVKHAYGSVKDGNMEKDFEFIKCLIQKVRNTYLPAAQLFLR